MTDLQVLPLKYSRYIHFTTSYNYLRNLSLSLIDKSIDPVALIKAEDEIDKSLKVLSSYKGYLSDMSLTIDDISIFIYGLMDAQNTDNFNHPYPAYPPEYVFPRNPNISQFINPTKIVNEKYSPDGTGLTFDYGFNGSLNIIRTKHPPYLDRKYFNFALNRWEQSQIELTITGNPNVTDITPYFSNSVVNLSGLATGINDKISYYFDGEKIVTNFDFSNIGDRALVRITYYKLLNSLRVKAVMQLQTPGISYYTPVIDQFTLLVDKQRVL